MPEDRPLSITSTPHLTPDEVARHTFATTRRGFDPSEVRDYLESVAEWLRERAERESEFRKELADAEYRATHPVLDEETLTTALGQETARVLHSAHEAANETVAKAEAEATRLITTAQEENARNEARIEAQLNERASQVEATAAEVRRRAQEESTSALDAARAEAEGMIAQARTECRDMIDETQALRSRVLTDLTKRRKVLHAQIEQLRAGREHMAETVRNVRRSIDTIADDLFRAEDQARVAAEGALLETAARTEAEPPEGMDAALAIGTDDDPLVAGSADDDHESSAGVSVDALFAKIRAARGARAEGTDQPDASADIDEVDITEVDDGAGTGADGVDATEPESDEDGQSTGADGVDAAEDDTGPPAERSPFAVRRDELIAPIVVALARRMKRTLQDDQNDLLDRLRSHGFHWAADIVPDEREHYDAYATAALSHLEDACEAGGEFVDADGTVPGDDLAGVAHELAEAVVGPLRRRLLEDEPADDGDESATTEHVGSAYREWKGERVESLAGDFVSAAFSAGSLAGLGGDSPTQVEWIAVSGSDASPCPDCEDNALNGPLSPGEEFPTGHRYPPVHPGCRCLVAPAVT